MKSLRVDRSSRPEVFCKKGVLRNFSKCFPVHFAKFLRTPFSYRTSPVAASENINERRKS